MKRTVSSIAALASATLLATSPAAARSEDRIGLGVALGASIPIASATLDGGLEGIQGGLKGASFDWGFFVDIPLMATFHLSPSAMLYQLKVNDQWRSVTDVDLNFKFIVPIGALSLHGGVLAGLTSGADLDANTLTMHGGLLGGLGYNLVANLDAFVLVNYKMLFHNLEKVNNLHAYGGLMFRL